MELDEYLQELDDRFDYISDCFERKIMSERINIHNGQVKGLWVGADGQYTHLLYELSIIHDLKGGATQVAIINEMFPPGWKTADSKVQWLEKEPSSIMKAVRRIAELKGLTIVDQRQIKIDPKAIDQIEALNMIDNYNNYDPVFNDVVGDYLIEKQFVHCWPLQFDEV